MEFRAELAAVAAAAHEIQGGAGDVQQVDTLLASLEHILQAGLKGTRTIRSLADVIQAMASAFPLQLSPALDTARHELTAQHAAEALLPRLWMQHAVYDGSLSTLLGSLRTQLQVAAAYQRDAPLRDRTICNEMQAVLFLLKGLKLPSALPSEVVAGAQANGSAGQMPAAAQGELPAAPHINQADRAPVPDGAPDAPGQAAGGLGGAAWLLGAGLHSSAGRLGSGLHSMVADGALPLGRAAFERVQATLGRAASQCETGAEPQAPPAGLAHRAGHAELTAEQQKQLQAGRKLAERVRVLALRLVQEGERASQGGPSIVRPGDAAAVCALVEQAADGAAQPAELGTQAIQDMPTLPSEADKLRAWIRAGLNERSLGQRLQALVHRDALQQQWCNRWAVLRQVEMRETLRDFCSSLDSLHFMLPVDVAGGAEQTGFLASVSGLLGKRRSAHGAQASAAGRRPGRPPGPIKTTASQVPGRHSARMVNVSHSSDATPASGGPLSPSSTTSLGHGLLSPQGSLLSPASSTDMGAEPLSPNTLTFLQNLRTAQPAVAETFGEEGLGSSRNADLIDSLLSKAESGNLFTIGSGARLSVSQCTPAAEPEAEPDGQPAAAVAPATEHEDLAETATPADLADLLGSSSSWKQAPQSPFEELQGYKAQPAAAVGGGNDAAEEQRRAASADQDAAAAVLAADAKESSAVGTPPTDPLTEQVPSSQEQASEEALPGADGSAGISSQEDALSEQSLTPEDQLAGSSEPSDSFLDLPATPTHQAKLPPELAPATGSNCSDEAALRGRLDALLGRGSAAAPVSCLQQRLDALRGRDKPLPAEDGLRGRLHELRGNSVPPPAESHLEARLAELRGEPAGSRQTGSVQQLIEDIDPDLDLMPGQIEALADMPDDLVGASGGSLIALAVGADRSHLGSVTQQPMQKGWQQSGRHDDDDTGVSDALLYQLAALDTGPPPASTGAMELNPACPAANQAGRAPRSHAAGTERVHGDVSEAEVEQLLRQIGLEGAQAHAAVGDLLGAQGGAPVSASDSAATRVEQAPRRRAGHNARVTVPAARTLQEPGSRGKEYTAYVAEVELATAGGSYEVLRRFSEFVALRASLVKQHPDAKLPQSWTDLSKASSVTGQQRLSPAVVSARCALLDHCMQELLQGPPALAHSPLVAAFLDPACATFHAKGDRAAAGSHAAQLTPPPDSFGQGRAGQPSCSQQLGWASSAFSWTQSGSAATESPAAAAEPAAPRSPRRAPGGAGGLPAIREGVEPGSAGLRLGSSIKLQTLLPPEYSDEELHELQQGECAACKQLLPLPGAKPSGWLRGSRKAPRRCEYTGLLHCPECQGNDSLPLPALVVKEWDFSARPVSKMVASFLRAIDQQPLLFVSQLNPGLMARVPLLARGHELRQKAAKALAAAREAGPEAAAKVEQLLSAAGARRYLLEDWQYWAMHDLHDLSKGAFSGMPQWLHAAAERSSSLATAALLAGR
eukprot:jgi/Astpho2/2804/fgenesh1_pg.00050_%23_87_t